MGRWMSPDWSAASDPVPYADFTDPQSLNLYGYVRNNPLSRADVDGHEVFGQVDVDLQQSGNVFVGFLKEAVNLVTSAINNSPPVGAVLAVTHSSGIPQFTPSNMPQGVGMAMADVATGLIPAAAEVEAPVAKEGIYEGPDATAPGRTYVGQSENIPRRLSEHQASGKFESGAKVKTREVRGGKTAREIAEQKRIQSIRRRQVETRFQNIQSSQPNRQESRTSVER